MQSVTLPSQAEQHQHRCTVRRLVWISLSGVDMDFNNPTTTGLRVSFIAT